MVCQCADCPQPPVVPPATAARRIWVCFRRPGKSVRAPARKNTTSAHLSKSSLTCGPSSDRHWPKGNSALRIRITALITASKSARAIRNSRRVGRRNCGGSSPPWVDLFPAVSPPFTCLARSHKHRVGWVARHAGTAEYQDCDQTYRKSQWPNGHGLACDRAVGSA